jgi:chromosome segregation ATPase
MESSSSLDSSAMWMQIQRMPFQQLKGTHDFVYIEKVMTLVARYVFSETDSSMADPKCTICVAKLLKIVCAKSLQEFERLRKKEVESDAELANAKRGLSAQLEAKSKEIERLSKALSEISKGELSPNAEDHVATVEELGRIKAENDTLSLKVQSLTRQTAELKQTLAFRSDDRSYINDTYDKAQLEYRHLAARYKRLADRAAKTEDMLEEMRHKERAKRLDTNDELERLRQKVQTLQQENYGLVQSRDRAEELCEKREAEALRDMTELRRLNRDLLEEERSKNQVLRDEFHNAKEEADAHVEQLLQQHMLELDEKEQEIAILRRQLEKAVSKRKGRFDSDNSSSSDGSSARSASADERSAEEVEGAANRKMRVVTSEEQRKVERENDGLRAEVEQLELRIDALDEENRRLTRLVKNYESGNEGLYRLRQELADQTRTVEMLQSENSQLRERLNGMEDSITFNAALRELCKRVGVTESEINSLRPQNATAYSEMDTLKEEVSLLKEEVEWLERERRYWMNKVRLQPLMDTKLRFELGLTSEQLKQLDKLVDQMKNGSVVVEDNDESYKDKYFKELQARRRDAEQFNTYVKQRINDALKDAFVDVSNANTAAAVSQLRDHIDVITTTPAAEASAHAEEKIRTMAQRLEELERAEKTRSEEIFRLREQVVAGNTEKEVISRERDQYREAIFGAAGMDGGGSSSSGGGDRAESPLLGDFGESNAGSLSNARWLKVSNTLREQLRTKDALIDTLGKEVNEWKARLEAERQREAEIQQAAERQKGELAALQDQIKALNVLNEEVTEKCSALSRVNKDLEEGLQRLDDGAAKEALLKVVLLRRREATLLQRLRRALAAQEETATSEEKLKSQVASTLEKLRETLENPSSTGSVLPRSSGGCSMEGEMLNFLDSAVQHVLQGKLFREDSRFLIHLRQVYQGMETREEVVELRLDKKRLLVELEEKQKALDELSAEAAGLRAAVAVAEDAATNHSPEYTVAARAKAEAEAATFKQKYFLLARRLEAREREVAQLEGDLDGARQEVVEVRDHIRNILSDTADPHPTSDESPPRSKADAAQVARLEKEVARLKSVNLGLLHHSLDLQAQVKSVEVEVAAKQQEITLLRASADSPLVTSFVTAAIREHAALRRQSELALIQAKRLRMQLAATEANYHVVANEAMNYKLGAYRLYRKYVDEVVAVVDYLRCVQRASKGSLSPHQAEIMDRRLSKMVADMGECFSRNKMLAMQLSDAQNALSTLEQQLSLLRMDDSVAKKDAIDAKLQEARTRVREHERLMVECKEETQYLQGKLARAEATNRDLNAEVARLEFGHLAVSPLDEQLLATLLQLKESVFDKTVAPPLSLEAPSSTFLAGRGRAGAAGNRGDYDGDVAIREYRSAILRQTELTQQCASLKKQLADVSAKHRRSEQKAAQLREELQQCTEKAAFAQRQVEEERQKASQRETRLQRAYETQSDVARRATEHNVRCLQEMIQKKEQVITALQGQLTAERQKYTEHELGEAVRMERLHEHMFRENTAMVERFKSAIETVGDSLRQASDSAEAPHLFLTRTGNSVEEQLKVVTAETVRLRQQLKEARTTNIVLESQLENNIHQQLSNVPAGGDDSAAQPGASAPREANMDALLGIVRNQTAMLESLRQRETHLSEELAREKEQRMSAERQLDDVQRQRFEQGGALHLLSQVVSATGTGTDAPLVSELRAQNAYLEQELCGMRQTLEEERMQARQFQMDAAEWRAHLDELQTTVVAQQLETERAQQLATLNEGLQADLNAVKEQNDRLVLAASVLKQKLMEEAHRSGESTRQHQQEIALAQRMATIQQESAGHMKVLDQRIRAIQKELNERVEKERSILEKNTESQRLVYQLHQQLRAKEREVVELQDQLRERGSASSPPVRTTHHTTRSTTSSPLPRMESKGTQMLSAKTPSPTRGKENAAATPKAVPGARATTAFLSSKPQQQHQQPPDLSSPMGHSSSSDTVSNRIALAPISAQDALLQPQIAGLVHRETQRQQRDNLAQISTLRSRVHRLEKDVEGAEEQLKGEREATRQLRLQLRQLRSEQQRKEDEYTAQLAAVYHRRVNAESQLSRQRAAVDASRPSGTPPPLSQQPPTLLPTGAAAGIAAAPSNAVGATGAEAALREKVAAQERTIQRYQQELEEVRQARVAASENVDPAYLASPSDVRAHVLEVRRLETVIDGLRHRLSVEVPARENELQHLLSLANTAAQRMAMDIASMRNLPVSEVESIYHISSTATTTAPTAATPQTTEELRSELLRKSNEILDLRFQVEALELRLSRTQRHLDEVLAVDGSAAASTKGKDDAATASVEALHNLVENLKLVIEKLQGENAHLRSAEAQSARYARQSRELHDLQERERNLQSQLQSLTQQLTHARGSSRSGAFSLPPSSGPNADMHRRLATAQAAAEQYESELNELRQRLSEGDHRSVRPFDPTQSTRTGNSTTSPRSMGVSSVARPTVPPPLPQSRFTHSHRQSSSLSSSASGGPMQRRLSANHMGRADDLGSDDHASMRHHHLDQL